MPYLWGMDWQNYNYHFEGLENHLTRVEEKQRRLDALRPLPTQAVKSIRDSLSLEWTYNSNSIEGNTLTLLETKMVLEDGLTIKGKSLREHFEAVNHEEAIEFVESIVAQGYLLTSKDILTLHGLVLQKIEKEFAGRYRNSGVRISGANFLPPNALKVDALMEALIDWVNDENNTLNIIIKASVFHHRFVWIHPFFDGNGLILN